MLRLSIISCLICVSVHDAIAQGYTPSGWRPSNAKLALPGEYGAPPVPTATPCSTVEVTRENVEFGGQSVEIASQNANYAYAQAQQQPKSTKSPNEEFLPRRTPPKPFKPELNTDETIVFPESSQLRFPVFVQTARLQYNPNRAVFSRTQQLPQFQQIRQFNANEQAQQQQNHPNAPPQVHETVDERRTDSEEDGEQSTETTTVTATNASGQYYILGKDNTLQRVMYVAGQTEDDLINNGFTAQLRYSPVEPIRDPVYGYDDQGQLVRIFNKK